VRERAEEPEDRPLVAVQERLEGGGVSRRRPSEELVIPRRYRFGAGHVLKPKTV
jgi:hypothetical protein